MYVHYVYGIINHIVIFPIVYRGTSTQPANRAQVFLRVPVQCLTQSAQSGYEHQLG